MRRQFPTDNDELLELIRPEMHRLAALDANGRAPSYTVWDTRRQPGYPCVGYLKARFGCGWLEIVELCGAAPSRRYVRRDSTMSGGAVPLGLADEIERGLASGTIQPATWMDRFRAVLHALPTPRVEQVMGRTVSGEPCVIERTYWVLR